MGKRKEMLGMRSKSNMFNVDILVFIEEERNGNVTFDCTKSIVATTLTAQSTKNKDVNKESLLDGQHIQTHCKILRHGPRLGGSRGVFATSVCARTLVPESSDHTRTAITSC